MRGDAAEPRSKIVETVVLTMSALAERNDDALRDVFARSRCEADDVYRTMDEYDAGFAAAPPGAYETIEIIRIDGHAACYAVDVDFWDAKGQRTDLTAQFTIELIADVALVEIDGVRIM